MTMIWCNCKTYWRCVWGIIPTTEQTSHTWQKAHDPSDSLWETVGGPWEPMSPGNLSPFYQVSPPAVFPSAPSLSLCESNHPLLQLTTWFLLEDEYFVCLSVCLCVYLSVHLSINYYSSSTSLQLIYCKHDQVKETYMLSVFSCTLYSNQTDSHIIKMVSRQFYPKWLTVSSDIRH